MGDKSLAYAGKNAIYREWREGGKKTYLQKAKKWK